MIWNVAKIEISFGRPAVRAKRCSTAGILDAARVERQRPRLGVEPEMEMRYVEFPMRDNLFLRKENMLLLFFDLALMCVSVLLVELESEDWA